MWRKTLNSGNIMEYNAVKHFCIVFKYFLFFVDVLMNQQAVLQTSGWTFTFDKVGKSWLNIRNKTTNNLVRHYVYYIHKQWCPQCSETEAGCERLNENMEQQHKGETISCPSVQEETSEFSWKLQETSNLMIKLLCAGKQQLVFIFNRKWNISELLSLSPQSWC